MLQMPDSLKPCIGRGKWTLDCICAAKHGLTIWGSLLNGIAHIAFDPLVKGPAESGQICSVGRRKIAKKIAKNKRCYANTLRPRSRMLLKVMKGG